MNSPTPAVDPVVNSAQLSSWLKTGLGIIAGALFKTAWTQIDPTVQDAITTWGAAGIAVAVPVLWGYLSNTFASLTRKVAAVPGATVVVSESAPPSLKALAKDDSVKDVVSA